MADLHSKILDAPPRSKFLSISCSFWEILAKSYVGAPLPTGELAPPPRGNPGSTTDLSRFGRILVFGMGHQSLVFHPVELSILESGSVVPLAIFLKSVISLKSVQSKGQAGEAPESGLLLFLYRIIQLFTGRNEVGPR